MDPLTESNGETTYLCQLLYGHVIYEATRTAKELGIFDALADGKATCQELAAKCNVPKTNFAKLLDALCALKLLKKEINENDTYENTDISNKYLLSSKPHFLTGIFEVYRPVIHLIGKTLESVKKGHSVHSQERNVFLQMENDDKLRRCFHERMQYESRTVYPLLNSFDIGQYKRLADLGGSTGNMARQIASKYPDMELIVFDLPKVIELALSLPENKNTKIKFVPGNFFKDPLPKADIYSFCHVLVDWKDDECDTLFRKVYENLNPGGAILIMDYVLNNDRVGPLQANLTEVILLNAVDGKHRSFDEFSKLLRRSGFDEIQLFRTDEFCVYDAILAKRT